MESSLYTLLTFSGLWTIAVITPGPDFLMITRTAITLGRREAHKQAVGVVLGIVVWGLAGYLGIHALFEAVPWLYMGLKLGGGAYLIYIGWRLLKASFSPAPQESTLAIAQPKRRSSFQMGLLTNLSNPKVAIFTASLFAATLPANPSVLIGLTAIFIMASIGAIWFALVIRILTTGNAARLFLKAKRGIDRSTGALFLGFGARLMATASPE